ncbi:hypothetical protein TNCT6_00630 [Streptomyces sp. 6-11-2]|nr:hypothetical protein TNCT6_00630 [Streptomyces sp. 6-11-2]
MSPLLTESGTSNCVPSSARRRRPRHHAPGVSGAASGPATCRRDVARKEMLRLFALLAAGDIASVEALSWQR